VSPISPKAASFGLSAAPFAAEGHSRVAREDGDDHREALRIDSGRDTPGHRQVRGRDERLNL
jgi:hypothetical protein